VLGFYDPILGIKNLSQKMSTTASLIFAGATTLILYILEVITRIISYSRYATPDAEYVLRVAWSTLLTYGALTFGIAGLAMLVATMQNSKRNFSEVLAAVSMSVVPGALVRILWGYYAGMLVGELGSFFTMAGRAYIAILVFEHVKDDNLSGRKQFLTAAIITIVGMAISATF
jgi:hypothetical protein